MIFTVRRVSQFDDTQKPCEEAFRGVLLSVDIRTISDPSEFNDKTLEKNWYKEGTNHRLINGCIARDMGMEEVWLIEFENLEQLLEFKEKYDDIIIRTSYIDNKTHEILIYDDYLG